MPPTSTDTHRRERPRVVFVGRGGGRGAPADDEGVLQVRIEW